MILATDARLVCQRPGHLLYALRERIHLFFNNGTLTRHDKFERRGKLHRISVQTVHASNVMVTVALAMAVTLLFAGCSGCGWEWGWGWG